MSVNIINDFFYLSWECEPVCSILPIRQDDAYQKLLEENREYFCDASAIVLSISSVTLERFMALDETDVALDYFILDRRVKRDRTELYALQCRLLAFLIYQGDLSLNKEIGKRLDRLRKEGIIGYDTSRKLISLLTLIEQKQPVTAVLAKSITAVQPDKQADSYYKSSVQQLQSRIALIEKNIEDKALLERLEAILKKLSEQRFSIGITGVMNAGKSTMLNALLSAEILGTSVVPETANLTVIKYAKEPKAVVNFWNRSQWKRIEQSAEALESMRTFVTQTKQHFSDALETYITTEGRSEEVAIGELPRYTSAEHSDMRCNLVKSVDLYHDLEFVRDGVEIVDTPGLDDPVIQREEITKEYLLDCDLMCHLMNVGQSATQKDISFIIDTLLYRNVAQLLIVITRIDMVSEAELEEVIAYTKSSIKTKLESLGKGTQLASVLERIAFIPIAGKMALLHRTGRAEEAIAAGYDLERSGILEIEAYLRNVLFGEESHKARLIIAAANKELLHILESQIACYLQEQELLGKSATEIAQSYRAYQEEIADIRVSMQTLNEAIAQSREELVGYFTVLNRLVSNKLQSLQEILKRRIMDDVSYTLRKEKRKPAPQRIATMIETGLQDGFIDLLREYRYGFQKRVEMLLEKLSRHYEGFAQTEVHQLEDAKTFFQQHFASLGLVHSPVVLIEQINHAIAKHSKRDQDRLAAAVEGYLHETMQLLEEKFQERAERLQQALLDDFEQRASKPMERVQAEIESRESLLREAQQKVEDSSYDTQKRRDILEQKQQLLSRVQADILQEGL